MAGISSKAASFGGAENKFKYNGIEQNNDFDLNMYDAFYRNLDPQIGRFWQIDPKPDESQSLYSAMRNNPILFNDLLGDTARFYNSVGVAIYSINDGNKRITPTIISNDNFAGFLGAIAGGFAGGGDGPSAESLQAHGITYDTKSISKFFDDNGKAVPAKTVDAEKTQNMSDIKIDGKSTKLYAEVMGNLVLKDGKVTVGTGKASSGDFRSSYFSELPGEANKVGDIHTHPVAQDGNLSYTINAGNFTQMGGGKLTAGPSGADHTHAGSNSNGARNVVVDSKYIYIINSNSNQTIKILRK